VEVILIEDQHKIQEPVGLYIHSGEWMNIGTTESFYTKTRDAYCACNLQHTDYRVSGDKTAKEQRKQSTPIGVRGIYYESE